MFGNSKWYCILFHQPGPVGSGVKGRAPKHRLLPKKSLYLWVPTTALLLFKDEWGWAWKFSQEQVGVYKPALSCHPTFLCPRRCSVPAVPLTQAAEARTRSAIHQGSCGAAEFMGHVWERPEEVSDASVYAALVSLTSWLLWVVVSDAQSHWQHLSVWSVMAWAPQQPELFQHSLQSCSPCSAHGGLLSVLGALMKMWCGLLCFSGQKEKMCLFVSLLLLFSSNLGSLSLLIKDINFRCLIMCFTCQLSPVPFFHDPTSLFPSHSLKYV